MTRVAVALLALVCASLCEFSAVDASAATVELGPGASRTFTLNQARPVAMRLRNDGDCSVGIVFLDSSRNQTLSISLEPTAVIDLFTPSAEVKYATINVRDEGTTGLVLVGRALTSGAAVRLPREGTIIGIHDVYRNEEGIAGPTARYRIENAAEAGGHMNVRWYRVDGSSAASLDPGESIDISGVIERIDVHGQGAIAVITRNP